MGVSFTVTYNETWKQVAKMTKKMTEDQEDITVEEMNFRPFFFSQT